jgi:outer membrane receptor protein involved in Fe transport
MKARLCAGLLTLLLAVCFLSPVVGQDAAPAIAASDSAEAAPQPGTDFEAATTTPSPEVTSGEEETAETEIGVEVVGKREGLLSISPAPGEQVSEVTAVEIQDSGAKTVLDSIDLTPSVFVRHQGARYENRLSIRGQAPRLVLLDGIPIAREGSSGPGGGAGGAESSFAGRILYTMPAEMIERIDIIRSANSIVYGPASSAGAVINIVTKDPTQGSKTAGTMEYGSFDHTRATIDAGVNDGDLGFYLLGGTEYSGSHLPLGEKRFADAFGKVFYNYPDGSRLFVEFFSLDGRRTLDLSQDFTIVPARYWKIDPWQEQFANLVYSKALSEDATLDFVTYQRNRDFTTNQFTSDAFSTVSMNWLESQDDSGADLRYSVRREGGAMTRVGLQWSDLSSDTLQTQYIGPSGPLPKPKVTDVSQDRSTWSAFANHTVPVRTNLRASLGARYDNMDAFSPDLTFSLGLEATVSPKTAWYLNLGTGAEHPEPTAGDAEQDIVPPKATSVSAETGWTVRPDDARAWTFALFWAKTRDARVLYNDPPGSIGPLAFISKAEDLTTSGVEVIYNRRVNDRLSWFANYAYLREDVTNHNPPAIPGPVYPFLPEPPKGIAAVGLRADAGKTRVALSAKYASDHLEQSRLMKTAAPVDAFIVFDLTVRHPVGRGELAVAINNLLDADYETMPAFPRPGRNYLLSYRTAF